MTRRPVSARVGNVKSVLAAKMDRERELKIIRRAYAKQVTAAPASEIRKSRRPSPRWENIASPLIDYRGGPPVFGAQMGPNPEARLLAD